MTKAKLTSVSSSFLTDPRGRPVLVLHVTDEDGNLWVADDTKAGWTLVPGPEKLKKPDNKVVTEIKPIY